MNSLLYVDKLVLHDEPEEDLKVMLKCFVEVCKGRGLKFNADKSKVVVLGGQEGLKCEVLVNGIQLKHVSEFKYLVCVLDESGTYEAIS